MSHNNTEDSKARRTRHRSALYDTLSLTLTASHVMLPDSPNYLFLNGGTSDRTVFLPVVEIGIGGQQYIISNTGLTNVLNIVDFNGVAVFSLTINETGMFFSSATEWRFIVGSSSVLAPTDADYLVKTANSTLSAERVVTDTTSITWDWTTAGQAKAKRSALTGDVTASADTNATTIATNAVTNAKAAQMAANTIKGNNTGSTANAADLTVAQINALLGIGLLQSSAIIVDFSVAGDNSIIVALPTGFTQMGAVQLFIFGIASDISAANFGLFTAVGGGGAAMIAAATAITVTNGTANTNNNYQLINTANFSTESYTPVAATIYFRVGTTASAGRTAKVMVVYRAVP